MNLDFFNNLINKTKENKVAQNFINELGEFLEKNKRNEQPLVQKILDGRILTTRYRDEINIQKHDIINNYSKENGEIYYIYNKRSDNTYGVVCHKNGEDGGDIAIKESQLPAEAELDCVLREQNGRFVLDKEATAKIQEELTKMINKLLEEQANRLEAQRVEGHVYEFVEKAGDVVELIDETKNTGECFEEIDFPKDLLENAKQGDKFTFVNGEYKVDE